MFKAEIRICPIFVLDSMKTSSYIVCLLLASPELAIVIDVSHVYVILPMNHVYYYHYDMEHTVP